MVNHMYLLLKNLESIPLFHTSMLIPANYHNVQRNGLPIPQLHLLLSSPSTRRIFIYRNVDDANKNLELEHHSSLPVFVRTMARVKSSYRIYKRVQRSAAWNSASGDAASAKICAMTLKNFIKISLLFGQLITNLSVPRTKQQLCFFYILTNRYSWYIYLYI